MKKNKDFTAKVGTKSAFTLAEVLITLAIIGVVAAMTIPALMTSTRGKEYEVGAQKALSTLANAMQMRYSMDGQMLSDYAAKKGGTSSYYVLIDYLTKVPDNARPGEQPALPTVQNGLYANKKMKDGAIILDTLTYNGEVHYIFVDTNGEKGPTRTNRNTDYRYVEDDSSDWNKTGVKTGFGLNDDSSASLIKPIHDADGVTPTDNNNPDIVFFAVNPHTNEIKPAGQRTRNIMATGNATISQ